ncbi:MAG TPA: TraR/DksA family transcriptional regulator [Caldimonas sp.]|jgi:RNA polymerase-binding protein DksA|nr:TraR/DksA family transcriptional regulator [Caldimonas sp.]HEX2543063.1 TraR/DksA family transcriptional regulator [Caldimonas sp.]
MPALDDTQLQQLRSQLERRRLELLDEVKAVDAQMSEAPSKQPHNQVEDLGELGEQRIREAVVVAEQERDVDELRQIAAAQERMARGEYGECVDCGIDIPFQRLQAQPAAARCVPCQEKYEQTHDNVVRIPPMS